ncbi:hypothetical protein FOL47_008918 [Perkinsus chesapeaki]|uniref:FAD-binding domain-containing protein n=1 Tax=Perkinsus chesapeaki TaxID=330153 RepID=A0A7J6LAZ1_PERCH|nr:hypothetical protein FOL47_008918 [Perkinsus chesapeaki]
MTENQSRVVIVGCGPVGGAMGCLFRKHGYDVNIYERYNDIRKHPHGAGRSINLVLTRRGLRFAEMVGVKEKLLSHTVPVYGRTMHDLDGKTTYTPYGREGECNFSVDRSKLNEFWITEAENAGAVIHFDRALSLDSTNLEARRLCFVDSAGGEHTVDISPDTAVVGCDGAGSRLRYALKDAGVLTFTEDMLDHDYKELTFPPLPTAEGQYGKFSMHNESLHIWPRGDFFLMALANLDGGFTGTIYARNRRTGEDSDVTFPDFTESESAAKHFLHKYFPDAPLGPNAAQELVSNPQGKLGIVRCNTHTAEVNAVPYLLVGDAAHAIVPFFGQGCNCGFEDCIVLDEHLLDKSRPLAVAFRAYAAQRLVDTNAIADMALDNFIEMMSRVADPKFLLHKAVEMAIMREVPQKYRSRYTLVMYSYIPYSKCMKVGERATALLEEIITHCKITSTAEVESKLDMEFVTDLLAREYLPYVHELGVSLVFAA